MVTDERLTQDWDPSPPAPGHLEAVRHFVNTVDCYRARDELADVGTARQALPRIQALLSVEPVAVGNVDLAVLRAGRAGLRAALGCSTLREPDPVSHPGGSDPSPDVDAGAARLVLRADATGVHAACAGTAAEALIGRLLLAVLIAQHDGTVARLKVCDNPGCQWVFWDSSRPGSARWCSMRICGGQAKARRYRERRAMAPDD